MTEKECIILVSKDSSLIDKLNRGNNNYKIIESENIDSMDILCSVLLILIDYKEYEKIANNNFKILKKHSSYFITDIALDNSSEKKLLSCRDISGIVLIGEDPEVNNLKINKLLQNIPDIKPFHLDTFKLDCLANALSDLVFFKNTNSIYIDCNEAFCVSTNKSKSEIIGKTDFDIFHPDTAKEFIENDKLIITSKKTNQSEDWIKYPNGEESLLETTKIPYFDAEGNILGVLGFSRDITERKKAQRALRKTEEQYSLLAENMADVIWICNPSVSNLTYISPSIKLLTGLTKEEAINLGLNKILSDSSIHILKQVIKEAIDNKQAKKSFRAEIQYLKKDNTYVWTECIVNVLHKHNGQSSILGVTRDITKRKETEQMLKEKEIQLKEAQQLAEIASLEYDLKSNKLRFSENFFDVLGIIDYDLQANFNVRKFFEYIHSDDKSGFIKNLKAIFTKLENVEYTYRLIDSNEVIRNISSFTKFRFDEKMDPVTFLATFQNVTNQKINEKLKRNIELARKAADMREQFLANMSHEIRTPMTGIMGMIDFLLETNLDENQRDYAETIKHSSKSLLHIINDILLVSKIDAGKLEIKPTSFDIIKTIHDSKNLFKPLILQKKLELTTDIPTDIQQYIVADENRIKQILTNLLSNAIKFTETGSVKIQLSQQMLNKETVNSKIKIIDTGIGISKKDQKMLFTKFSQVDASLSRNQEGLGLGLTISKELVELMGGKIGVESEPEIGSTFWFSFNAKKSVEPAKNDQQKTTKAKHIQLNKKILFVEDKFVNQKVVSLMLENHGCEVTTANNGKEAIEKYSEGNFDLILMDIQMPIMDGLSAVRTLKNTYFDLPPVIAISANAMEGDAERYISSGMDDYIAKPVNAKTLISKIHKWLKTDDKTITQNNKIQAMQFNQDLMGYPLLNEETLKTINEQSGGDEAFLKMLFESFFEDSDSLINDIKEAESNDDYKLMKEAVHSLKGLAGTIGASRLHEITKLMDKNLKNENISDAVRYITDTVKIYEDFKNHIETNYFKD